MKYLFIGIILLYRRIISPLITSIFGNGCRFTPSCSQYTIEALEKFGTVKGLYLGGKRLARCHPWGPSGFDPVPEK